MAERRDLIERLDRKLESFGIRVKDEDQLKVRQDVFDEATLIALYRLANRRVITSIGGAISTGKEANIFFAERDQGALALKIYMMRTANFKAMTEYLDGDPRFSGIRRTRKDIIFAWTRKEFSNLKRAHEAGIPVPEPHAFERNILIMDFLGEGERPYPQLRLVELPEPEETYQTILGYIKTLFQRARLVHADLSEYNILYGDKPYVIDMGQAVTLDHPRAMQFLARDVANINRYFSDRCRILDEKEIVGQVTEGFDLEP
ncbi:MAG: serine protein kinase RIO [Methanomicrobiales archaeon]|nr:serine protein kinase RIO [Methanomicrobiales archaeon]